MTYPGKFPVLALSVLLLACGPSGNPGDDDDTFDAPPGSGCAAGETRCLGTMYQTCVQGQFADAQQCAPQACMVDRGCVACNPAQGGVCVGDEAHACNLDGSVGTLLETCDPGTCVLGTCEAGSCASGTELIYVVDTTYKLYSFQPAGEAYTFTLIGSLSCPAGAPLGTWPTPATPFSMSVDRDARAWVLYTSGQIFFVDTQTAACSASGWSPGSGGYQLFGMGFVADAPGADTEKLYINGGAADEAGSGTGNYASIDPGTFGVTTIGPLTGNPEFSPELTGTGNAELYGYFPGMSAGFVARVNKTTGANEQTWPLPSLGDPLWTGVSAWAFAHWGGDFFIFVTTTDLVTMEDTPQVWRLDADTGTATQILSGAAVPVIVGAGVSTCAPVVVE